MSAAAWRSRRARGRRTAGAFSYSTQPPRPVAELTLAAETQEAGNWMLEAGGLSMGRTPESIGRPDLAALPGLPALAIDHAASRLTLAAPTLDESLSL